MSKLTSKGSLRFRLAQVYYPVPRRKLALEKQIVERMMDQGKSHSVCEKKQVPPEAPSVNLQQEDVQSAKQTVSVMLLQTRHSGYLTMPLKDPTSTVHYLG
jgi:hypothetical protein